MLNNNLPPIPNGYRLLEDGEKITKGYMFLCAGEWTAGQFATTGGIQGSPGYTAPRIIIEKKKGKAEPKPKYYLCLPNDVALVYRKDNDFEGYWSPASNDWVLSCGHIFNQEVFLPITEKQAHKVINWQRKH